MHRFPWFLTAGLVLWVACGKKPAAGNNQQATSVASLAPSAPPPPASVASAAAPPTEPSYPARTIAAGMAPNGTWTVAFAIERKPGDLGLDWWGAVAHCSGEGQALCTETQWLRACQADPKLGEAESWTLTADVPGAVVRGGEKGCQQRSFVKTVEQSATRGAFCCQRALGITSEDKTDEFRQLATEKVLAYEAALHQKKAEPLQQLYAETVTYLGKDLGRGALVTQQLGEAAAPDSVMYFDHCDVKHGSDAAIQDLLADCGVVSGAERKVRGFAQRIAFRAAERIYYVGDPKGMKKGEQKERVRSFLPSGE